ncbi:MAG: hypothetical protein WCT05_02935, partial [Lentisphaeria bacterium]
MKQSYRHFLSSVQTESLLRHTGELLQLELGQTFSCYHASAQRTLEILQETGIPNAEKISFPADGKTAYQDKITPLGWEASLGKLTILKGDQIEPGFVAADYQQHPFHLIKGSCAAAPGGETVRIILDQQLIAGEDPHDALILVAPNTRTSADRSRYLDLGARGIISDYAMNAADA